MSNVLIVFHLLSIKNAFNKDFSKYNLISNILTSKVCVIKSINTTFVSNISHGLIVSKIETIFLSTFLAKVFYLDEISSLMIPYIWIMYMSLKNDIDINTKSVEKIKFYRISWIKYTTI